MNVLAEATPDAAAARAPPSNLLRTLPFGVRSDDARWAEADAARRSRDMVRGPGQARGVAAALPPLGRVRLGSGAWNEEERLGAG